VCILYLAHLTEPEKQFFVTLLLEEVLSWMHAQSGTTSLRALLYMDEMFGYLPPHPANPPTKKPLLTLLKQARAFGLGLILATQNPVDLDYKALSNAGTWFIGRMQTDRDKQRLLDGLEGVQVSKGGTSRAEFDQLLSAVRSRVFLLHNVHEAQPLVFHTRWAMSYLRGPLTRNQVQDLAGEEAPPAAAAATAPAMGVAAEPSPAPVSTPGAPASRQPETKLPYNSVPPQLPSTVKQVYLPVQSSLDRALERLSREQGWSMRAGSKPEGHLVYQPALVGLGKLRFAHTKSRQTHSENVAYLLPLEGEGFVVDWSAGKVKLESSDLERESQRGALFAELPSELGASKRHTALKAEFEDYLYYNSAITLLYNPHVELYSEPGESPQSFQRRCRKAVEDAHRAEAKKMEAKYERELDRLEDKLRREEQELEEDKIEHDARKQEELLSGVESVVSIFTSKRLSSRLSTASRRRRMTRKAKADIEESEDVIEELEDQIEELEGEARRELEELAQKWGELIDDVEEIEVRPRRADVLINVFALAWLPRWEVMVGDQALAIPAFEAEGA
jgi:hypothetical protein